MFMSELVVSPWGEKDGWVLKKPLKYLYNGTEIVVPTGFVTDLASVPKIATLLFPINGLHRKAAVLHDWLYTSHKVGRRDIKKSEADLIFKEAMLASGVSEAMADVFYKAVKFGGHRSWKKE